ESRDVGRCWRECRRRHGRSRRPRPLPRRADCRYNLVARNHEPRGQSMRRLSTSFRLGAIALALALPVPAAAQNIGLPLGSTPEAVEVEDLDGNVVDLGQYIGKKPMFVEFWATWCPLCEALQPRVDAAHERFGDQVEFVIVAVGVNQNPR